MSYTKEQFSAVTAPKGNLLVTAAAGAGKTHVLTGRIIGRITNPEGGVDVDRLLIVTFTKAAAAEMRERIDAAISEEMKKFPGSQRLSRQLALLSNASINTIDAFCQKVVREYFYRLDLSPSFRMLDPAEEEVLLQEQLEETMESLHKEEHGDFLLFADTYASARSDYPVAEMIRTLYREAESVPFREEYLSSILAVYEASGEEWKESLTREAALFLQDALSRAKSAAEKLTTEKYQIYFADTAARLEEVLSRDVTFASLSAFLREGAELGKKPIAPGAEEKEKKAFDVYRDFLKSTIIDAKNLVGFTEEDAEARKKEVAPLVRGLVAAVERLIELTEQEKRRRNAFSFADVERLCLTLLAEKDEEGNTVPSTVAKEIAERYDEIYIDEYQDSNEIQEWIFRLVSGEWTGAPNMFMVGDLKQSIYRFRHSDPSLFRAKKETYGKDASEKNRKIELSKNFRSRKEVIDGINMLFRSLMTSDAGEVEYNEEEELAFGSANYDFDPEGGNACELLLMEKASTEGFQETEEEELSFTEKEAVLIGRKIRALVDSGFEVFDKVEKRVRPIRYRDIAVLLRGMGSRRDAFSYVFEKMGIPLGAGTPGGYYDALEVRTFLALLSLIDNPRQDIPLAAVLSSPIVGMSESDLSVIRLMDKKVSLFDALLLSAEKEEEISASCRTFLERLSAWRKAARTSTIDELLSYLFADTGWYAYVGALPGGDLRQANLRALHRQSAVFEQSSGSGLFSFITAIEKSRELGQDLEPAGVREGDLNVVNLMTIHKSKGLEFPVVFVASLGSEMNRRDLSGNLIVHPRLGVGLKYVDRERKIRYTNPYREALVGTISNEMISEELRVLYVALTRAREKLILTGAVRHIEEKKEEWAETELSPTTVRRAKTFMDWVGPCVMQDKENLFKVSIFPHESLYPEEMERAEEENEEQEIHLPDVEENLSFRYPYEPLTNLPPLLTVTELKGRLGREEEDSSAHLYAPQELEEFVLLEEKEISPMEKGSVNHFVMQHIDVKRAFGKQDVKEAVAEMVEKDLITSRQAECVDILAITKFLESPLCERMRKAEKIYRESPFMMSVPCASIPGMEAGGEEEVVVQGIVDCWFEDEKGIVVLDYKTDRTGDAEEIKKRYRTQMDLYEKALLLKNLKKSSEKFIYLFYNGSIIEM